MKKEETLSRIKNTIMLLNEGKSYNIGDLYFSPQKRKILNFKKKDTIQILAYTKCHSLELMTAEYALYELKAIKRALNDLENISEEFRAFIKDYDIEYVLSYNYGMGAIGICSEKNDVIKWLYKL